MASGAKPLPTHRGHRRRGSIGSDTAVALVGFSTSRGRRSGGRMANVGRRYHIAPKSTTALIVAAHRGGRVGGRAGPHGWRRLC